MKKIAILGSTGSIGTQTLDVVRGNKDIQVLGISAGRNILKLEEQVREEEERTKKLEEYKVYVKTKQFAEEVAKEKLGLVNPDEILLKPNQ